MTHMRMAVIVGLGFLIATARPGLAAPDVKLDVPAQIAAKVLKDQITAAMNANPSWFLSWRPLSKHLVTVSRGPTEDQLHARLELTQNDPNVGDVNVTIDLDVFFGCGFDGVAISINHTEVDVGPAKNATKIENASNAMVAKATGPILAALWKKLQFVEDLPGNHFRNCPHFEISTAGALHAELDFENGCINGTQTVVPCPAGFEGLGSKFIRCGNGELYTIAGTCKRKDTVDPPAPPGGNQP